MTRLRLAAPGAVAALVFSFAGGSLAVGQTAGYPSTSPQTSAAPQATQYAPYGGDHYQYQPPAPASRYEEIDRYTGAARSSTTAPQAQPYTATSATPVYRVAERPATPEQMTSQSQTAAQPQAASGAPSNSGGYQLPDYGSYQRTEQPATDYRAPAPGDRYALRDHRQRDEGRHDDNDRHRRGDHRDRHERDRHEEHAEIESEVVPSPEGHQVPPDAPQPSDDWESYVQAPAAGGGYYGGQYGECDYGTFGGGSGHMLGDRLRANRVDRQWFYGVYGLFMGRDNPGYRRLAVSVDDSVSYPYYPSQDDVVLSTSSVEPDFQGGAEVRVGSTFGTPRSCDPCGTTCGTQPYAWEFVYWGLAEDTQSAVATDVLSDMDRMYSMVNYNGLEYDRGGGARWLSDYFDYDMPINDPMDDTNDVRVLGRRVRNTFSAQNLELNIIRFPMTGCGACDPCCPPRFTVNGSCGIRYMKLDENFQDAVMFSRVDGDEMAIDGEPQAYFGFPSDNENVLFYDINTDNEMVGFQLGSNMNWTISSRWSGFCDTQFGIYGNRITNRHRVWSGGGGPVTYIEDGEAARIRTEKTDVSFLTEIRAGLGYQIAHNCRLTAAYRVIAITGVALSVEQIPTDWSNSEYVGIIDSNDSLVLHGLQSGIEWKY